MNLEGKLTGCLSRAVEAGELAGVNILVRKNGEDICYAQAGSADIAAGRPVARDSIFRLYSQSKPVTAAAAMILIERGILDPQEGVDKYLPGFANGKVFDAEGRTVPENRAPWIMELLDMTAGLSYPDADPAGKAAAEVFDRDQQLIREGRGMDTVTFCNELGKCPRAFQPGTHWRYSTCADILAAVIEVASGKKYGDFLREELFEPLGMKDTGFWVPPEKADRLVTPYRHTENGLEPWVNSLHLAVGLYDAPPAYEAGGAGLVSTVDDYAAFAQMLLGGGMYKGRRVLSEATVRYMTGPQLDPVVRRDMWDSLCGYNYGHLLRICDEPGALPLIGAKNEYGWDGWLGTYFINLPDQQITILCFQNTCDAGTTPVVRRCRSIIGAELL